MSDTIRPFERRWSTEQRAALAYAMLDARPKLSAGQTAKAALAGTLPGPGKDLAPFGPVPVSTIYDAARRERKIRHSEEAVTRKVDEKVLDVIRQGWKDLETAMRRSRSSKLSPVVAMKAVREYSATAMHLRRCELQLDEPSTQPEAKQPPSPASTEASDLARAARKRARTEQSDAPPTETKQGAGSVRTTATALGSTEHATNSAEHERSNGTQLMPQSQW